MMINEAITTWYSRILVFYSILYSIIYWYSWYSHINIRTIFYKTDAVSPHTMLYGEYYTY